MEYKIAASALGSVGISMDVSPPADGELWGFEDENGQFSGITGELQRKSADIAWANLFVQDKNLHLMSYTDWYANNQICVLVPGPVPYPKILGLVMPFDGLTWLWALLSMATAFVVLLVYVLKFPMSEMKGIHVFSFVVSLSINQSCELIQNLKGQGLRVGAVLYLLGMYILCIGYAGSLMSVLTVTVFQSPLNSLGDLAEAVRKVMQLSFS